MVSDTLLIRHLPASLAREEVNEFLKHIGAIQVFIHESKIKKYNYAFAKFENEQVAQEVLSQIHQKEILDSRLVAEFADNGYCTRQGNGDKKEKIVNEENKKTIMRGIFLRNLNNWTAGLNLTLPPPYHLKYRYPVPNSRTILNIANMLSFNVKFYTQVVHLMNKMNLPSPFESTFSLHENGIFDSFITYILENTKNENDVEKMELSTENNSEKESELESENEENTIKYSSSTIPFKRKSLSIGRSIKKRRLLKSTVTTASKSNKTPIEDVFEKVERDSYAKKIELKISAKSGVICRSQENSVDEIYEEFKKQDTGVTYLEEKMEEQSIRKPDTIAQEGYITAEELTLNRISERDWQMLPFFKNYHPGTPCCRLYIKNLSKHVVVSDLNHIFTRYSVANLNEQQTTFNVRLMQEGRMKGQAFVTLQNVELAELALKETNGYIIKGKPMVVQFAKTTVIQDKDTNSNI